MHGGGEDWITAPWDWMTGIILMGLAMMGAGGEMVGMVIDEGWG